MQNSTGTRRSVRSLIGTHDSLHEIAQVYTIFRAESCKCALRSIRNRTNTHYVTYEIVQEFDILYRTHHSSSYYRIEFRKRHRKPTSQGNKSPNNKPLGGIPGNRPLGNASLGSASPGNTPLGSASPGNTPLGTVSPSDTPPNNKLPSNKAAR